MISFLLSLAEKKILPDYLIRFGIRNLLVKRLNSLLSKCPEERQKIKQEFIRAMNLAPIALVPELANEQHYEIPSNFYNMCLGKNKKYSSCFWDDNTQSLNKAEQLALELTCKNARLSDGLNILELGCGWGSLTLWMAKKFPKSKITAVSNSSSQRSYIINQAKLKKLKNIKIITSDMNDFETMQKFDRVVSVEMIEHMRNHKRLFFNISKWLKPKGLFFMHIFVHHSTPYLFEVKDKDDWMSKYFFSGGMMPSEDLPLYFQDKLKIKEQWIWSGKHYEKTANAWLQNIDNNETKATEILEDIYGKKDAKKWLQRWRIFFMACAELWGFNKGNEWKVSHYLFKK